MRTLLAAALSISLSLGCAPMKPHDSDPPRSTAADPLAVRLAAVDLQNLAMSLGADPDVDALWRDYSDRALYVSLVEDAKRPLQVRFAAALALRARHDCADAAATAQVFATALQRDLAGYAQPWGRLWAGDDAGVLGAAVIDLGRAAIPALTGLLDDTTPRDVYVGNEEATELAARGYRVKDFAAFYLARIAGIALAWEPDRARRDAAIATLRTRL